MENENLDFDVKPAGNKDLWLFLIIIDIVVLCVCGFFLYKHFSTKIFAWTRPAAIEEPASVANASDKPALQEQPEVVTVTETTVVTETPVAPAVVPQEVAMTEVVEPMQLADEPTAANESTPMLEEALAPIDGQKKSIIVEVNPKSANYRRVTFRWFGEGDRVAIVSGFTNRQPQALRKVGDYWETTLSIAPGTYKFLYVVDGETVRDPYAGEKDGRSIVEVK